MAAGNTQNGPDLSSFLMSLVLQFVSFYVLTIMSNTVVLKVDSRASVGSFFCNSDGVRMEPNSRVRLVQFVRVKGRP